MEENPSTYYIDIMQEKENWELSYTQLTSLKKGH